MKIRREALREAVRRISGASISYEQKILRYLGIEVEDGPEQPYNLPLSLGTVIQDGKIWGKVLDGQGKSLMEFAAGDVQIMTLLIETYNTLYYHEP